MRNTTYFKAAVAGLMLTNFTGLASAEEAGGFSISLTVPVVCDLDADTFLLDADRNTVSGTIHEFCNTGAGFHVIAGHRPLSDGERVDVNYDGTVTVLDASGMSSIARRNGARARSIPVTINADQVNGDLAVSFSITAI